MRIGHPVRSIVFLRTLVHSCALSVKLQGGIESDGSTAVIASQTSIGGSTMEQHASEVVFDTSRANSSRDVSRANSSWDSDIAPTAAYLRTKSSDWFFHVQTLSCRGLAFDNDTHTLLSRVLLPSLFLCTLVAISLTGWGTDSFLPSAESLVRSADSTSADSMEHTRKLSLSTLHVSETKERLWHLDFARICAVFCVVGEHTGGEDYTHRNSVFGLWWVLPFLYMTSGMGCMLSRKTMMGYTARLVLIFIIGVSANWVADLINHRDWQHDFGNTVFQMFFVVMLIVMAITTEPLRAALQRRRDHELAKPTTTIIVAGAVCAAITLLGLWHFMWNIPVLRGGPMNSWLAYYKPILDNIPMMSSQVVGTLFLSIYATIVCAPEKSGLIGWYLLAYIYIPMVMIPWDKSNFSHCMALYIFAMVATVWPLQGSEGIASWVRSYWALLLMILLLVSMPDMWGRCDMHPPYATWERFRFNIGEFILVVCFITKGFAMTDPYNVSTWMGWWALYAYCFHIMWFRLLGCPYGALVTFSFIGVFYLLHHSFRTGKNAKNKNDASSSSSTDAVTV